MRKVQLNKFVLITALGFCATYVLVGSIAPTGNNIASRVFLDPPFYAVGTIHQSDAPIWGLVILVAGLMYSFLLGGVIALILQAAWLRLGDR